VDLTVHLYLPPRMRPSSPVADGPGGANCKTFVAF
jgi:hypothetical protein